MKMYEKIARTIQETIPGGEFIPWDDAILAAQCILAVMRVPTDEMLEAGPVEPYMDKDVWAAMIDAALKEYEPQA